MNASPWVDQPMVPHAGPMAKQSMKYDDNLFVALSWRRSLKFAYVAAPYCVLDALVDTFWLLVGHSNGRKSRSRSHHPLRSRTRLTTIAATARPIPNSSRSSLPASQAPARTKTAAAIGPPTVLVQIRKTCLAGRRVARRPAG